jgi:small subunit ribosomal protein S6
MRRYETIFIIDPDLSDEEHPPLFERLKLLFPQLDGFLVEVDEWGTRKLAYEIKKKARGYYVRLDYCGTGALVNEIERFFRIDDRVLKYMTVLIDPEVDLENLKAEIAEAEAKAEAAKEPPDQNDASDAEQEISEKPEIDGVDGETIPAENNPEEL